MRLHHSRRTALAVLATVSFAGAGAGAASATTPTDPTDTTTATDPTDTTMATAETMATTGSPGADSSVPGTGAEPTGPLCAAVTDAGAAGAMPTDHTASTEPMATSDVTMDTSTMDTATMDTSTMDTSTMDTGADATTGSDGGSMADVPLADAVGMNPLLTELAAAIDASGLADTLNSGEASTVLAPIDSAFAKLDPAQRDAALSDPGGLLATVLSYHVIPEQLSSTDLAAGGTYQSVLGEDITFEMRGETLIINDGAAAVQCADLPTANATVFLIDTVLLPPSLAGAGEPGTTTVGTTADSAPDDSATIGTSPTTDTGSTPTTTEG